MPSTVGEKFETIDFLSVAVVNTMKIVQLYKKDISNGRLFRCVRTLLINLI